MPLLLNLYLVLHFASTASGARILLSTASPTFVTRGTSVGDLQCKAACSSLCSIEWYRVLNRTVSLPVNDLSWNMRYQTSSTNTIARNGWHNIVYSTLIISCASEEYVGTYFCRAIEGEATANSSPIQLRLYEGGSSKSCRNHEEWINSCRLPNVNNFLAKENKITNATTNDATCITISWEFEGGNGTQWCDNVEFKLFITHWNSVQETPDSDFSSAETSSKEFSWILLHKAPLTSQSHFQTCQIDLKRYYEFRIQLKDLTTSQTTNVYSHVYYFGLQVPATVMWAPRVLIGTAGKELVMVCRVDGKPRPSITWLWSPGRSITRRPIKTNGYNPIHFTRTFSKINADFGGLFSCLVENKIVNPPKGARIERDLWTFRLDVKP